MSDKKYVFISYSSKDLDIAIRVCEFLEKRQIKCWMAPRDVDAGCNYATQIVSAIRNCSCFVLLASENTNVSEHVCNEVSIAFDSKKNIVPFKIQKIEFTDEFLYFLGRNHWIEAHTNIEQKLTTLLNCIKEVNSKGNKQITKIVITGGPCAGKTTGMSWIQNAFTEMGYVVLFVPETATELISGGVAPWTLNSNLDYQLCQMKLQLHKEKVFEEAAEKIYNSDKILIVCDRGTIDNKAYMSDGEFKSALSKLQLNETELRDSYDAVFHLVTAAKGAEKFYTLSNNKARTETIEEAAIMDDKLISAWTGHPHFRVIDNSKGFEDKMKQLVAEISSFLGEPEPYEIERKFLIEYPNIPELESNSNCKRVEIIQTYLNSESGDEVRVRQRGENGNYIYFKTIKKKVDDVKRVEIENRLTKDEYLTLLMDADTSKKQIRKTRYCLTYESQYFEIDVYPFWNDKAIVEIELNDENAEIIFPDFIKIIKEVTDDESYKNASLAKNGGK